MNLQWSQTKSKIIPAGVGIPKNSAGRLPWELLNSRPEEKAEAAAAVARQANQVT